MDSYVPIKAAGLEQRPGDQKSDCGSVPQEPIDLERAPFKVLRKPRVYFCRLHRRSTHNEQVHWRHWSAAKLLAGAAPC